MPSLTIQALELTLGDFQEPHPTLAGPLHFRDRFVGGLLQSEIDPLTGLSTGQTAQQLLAALGTAHGWPLLGLFVSQVGDGVNKHLILNRLDFPNIGGNPNDRAGKLTDTIQTALDLVFQIFTEVTDPLDDDFGETDLHNPFFARYHAWNYRADKLYEPKDPGGGGDHTLKVFGHVIGAPPSNWWVELS